MVELLDPRILLNLPALLGESMYGGGCAAACSTSEQRFRLSARVFFCRDIEPVRRQQAAAAAPTHPRVVEAILGDPERGEGRKHRRRPNATRPSASFELALHQPPLTARRWHAATRALLRDQDHEPEICLRRSPCHLRLPLPLLRASGVHARFATRNSISCLRRKFMTSHHAAAHTARSRRAVRARRSRARRVGLPSAATGQRARRLSGARSSASRS